MIKVIAIAEEAIGLVRRTVARPASMADLGLFSRGDCAAGTEFGDWWAGFLAGVLSHWVARLLSSRSNCSMLTPIVRGRQICQSICGTG